MDVHHTTRDIRKSGGARLMDLLLLKNDVLLERSSRVLGVMSKESTMDYLLEDDSNDRSECSSDA